MKFLSFILLFFVSFSSYSSSGYISAIAEERDKLKQIQEYNNKITVLDIDSYLVAIKKIITLSSAYSFVYNKKTPFNFEQMISKKFIFFDINNSKNIKDNTFTINKTNIKSSIFPDRVEISQLDINQFVTLQGELIKNENYGFLFSSDKTRIIVFFSKTRK